MSVSFMLSHFSHRTNGGKEWQQICGFISWFNVIIMSKCKTMNRNYNNSNNNKDLIHQKYNGTRQMFVDKFD